MSVIIRLQNLPWSANALDIRNFFRGLSIPEGGVHIVGGELGDAFIAFSTDEDARQAMMLDGGKIKEIQVKLLLSSRSEMHKVIETARQSVPILTLSAPAVAPPAPVVPATTVPTIPSIPAAPVITPFSAALGNTFSNYGIPGIGNPQEIPQPAVIEPPAPMISPPIITPEDPIDKDDEKKRTKEKDKKRSRSRTRSRSRDRDRKDRKRDRRDRSRSRDRRRRDRSRSRDRRDRKRDRKDRSRSRDRSPSRRSRDRRNFPDRRSPNTQEKTFEPPAEINAPPPPPSFANIGLPPLPPVQNNITPNGPINQMEPINQPVSRFSDPSITEAFNKLQELGKKRNPNAFQGDQPQNGSPSRFQGGRGGGSMNRGGGNFRRDTRESRGSRFNNDNNDSQRDCCVAIRNAPTHTSYGDVRRFFPFMIDKHGIKMINDHMGRRTGTIFVRFCDPRSKQLALQRRNNELKGAEVVVEPLEDEAYESAVDSFLPYREENEEEQPAELPVQDEIPHMQFSVLKLTELPHFVKEHDIIKAFSEYSLLSIMLNDCRITRTKTAFVQFVKAEDARLALDRKERYTFGKRQPTIVPCSDEDYDKEKSVQNEKLTAGSKGNDDSPVNNDQQPPAISAPEVVGPRDPRQRRQQLDNVPVPTSANPTPVAPFFTGGFVPGQQFPGTPFPGPQFGGYPGTGLDPRTAAANWANRPTFPNPMAGSSGPIIEKTPNDFEEETLDCVLMKGLPPEATDRTIVTFLSDTGAVPARIHLMLNANGLPSGDCFCEFRSPQEARQAASKHGTNLDGCRVTVDLVSRGVVEEALEGPKQQVPPPMDMPNEGLLGPIPNQSFYDPPRQNFPTRGGFRGRGYDRGYDRAYDRGGFNERGSFSERASFSDRASFSERASFNERPSFNERRSFNERGGYNRSFESGRGSFRGRGFNERGRFDRGRGRGFGRGRGGFENGRDMPLRDEQEPDPALEDFGAPGCVVSMENVPFKATVDDIMQFFSEFELTQDDIIRRYNDRGQPTGDARVAFRTPFDAQRAVKTRHMDTIHDRRINLMIL